MRVCLVYDCLYPHTVGGGERWYRNLSERLATAGHEVTYLTLRQWSRGEAVDLPGTRVIAVGPRMPLYTASGRRRVLPPLVFGAGVLWHLARHGRGYDIVHSAAFPYFSLLAAAALRRFGRYRLVVDWFEVWSRDYWRAYLGRIGGPIGNTVQAACLRVPQAALCMSRLYERRLRDLGVRGPVTLLPGAYVGSLEAAEPEPADDVVVFAGRHIPEKRAPAVVGAVAYARRQLGTLRSVIFGDGPERGAVLALRERHGLQGVVEVPGFVDADDIDAAFRRALCMILPSRREGYGMVVIEAARHGTPSIVVDGPDNAAVELVAEGVNGTVAASASPEDLGEAILRIHGAGEALRASTRAWFAEQAPSSSLERSFERVVETYGELASARS